MSDVELKAIKEVSWQSRDDHQYAFIEQKYQNRHRLSAEATEKRKLADGSQTINGAPNPLYGRLCLEADMAQMRFEMAYMVERNQQLQQHIETIEYLHQRVGIVEGAYSHTKMLAERCRIDYDIIQKAAKIIKEHK